MCNAAEVWTEFSPIVSNVTGDSLVWLISDSQGVIIEIDDSLPLNLDPLAPGICQVFALSHDASGHG